jgi:hypothetical protein
MRRKRKWPNRKSNSCSRTERKLPALSPKRAATPNPDTSSGLGTFFGAIVTMSSRHQSDRSVQGTVFLTIIQVQRQLIASTHTRKTLASDSVDRPTSFGCAPHAHLAVFPRHLCARVWLYRVLRASRQTVTVSRHALGPSGVRRAD